MVDISKTQPEPMVVTVEGRAGQILGETESVGRGSLVMWWERGGRDIGCIGRRDYLFVDKILDRMTQSETTVGVMTVLMVVCTVF